MGEIEYCPVKMKKFADQDALLAKVVKDLQQRGNSEEEALHLTFNSYVLEDFEMEEIFKNL
ncbi:hypothetical protein [Cytobacillus gottheilii]|uniref:hypothetical protein n=1 Tax=Cytobacillus gottheilii TaxID=859144 RepID=UPI0024956242|nr:hypothetical protein [Cytobacillus gottheilii]